MYLFGENLTQKTLLGTLAHESYHRALATDPKVRAAVAKFDGDFKSRFDLAAKRLGR